MNQLIWKLFGSRMAHKALAKHAQQGGLLDTKLGFALLRDRRVALGTKLFALALGFGIMSLLVDMELPVEMMLAVVLPIFGLATDVAVDSMEMVVGPALITCLLLPFLASREVVDQIRAERAGLAGGPVIDVSDASPRPSAPLRKPGFLRR